jgi:uncharacterized SAM-binding protein YcdF (DUF218 family)
VFLLPTGISIILLLVGLCWRKWFFCWTALLVFWLAATPPIGRWALRAAEGWQVRRSVTEIPAADAIVVLSGMLVDPPGDLQLHEFGEGVDRFEAGLALLAAEKAPQLIFTAGWVPWQPSALPEGDVLAHLAVERGVPRDRIYVTGRVSNTADEAQEVAAHLLRAKTGEDQTIILVTSAFHMRRALLLFEQAGLTVVAYPVDFRVSEGRKFSLLDLVPTATSLAQTETALRELYGYWFYRLLS